MLEYAKIHQARVTAADNKMHQLIKDSCNDGLETTTLTQIWTDETLEQESRAVQSWNKIERFLTRKKHEDNQRNQTTLTDMSWDETLSRRVKARRSAQQTAIPYHYASPWQHHSARADLEHV